VAALPTQIKRRRIAARRSIRQNRRESVIKKAPLPPAGAPSQARDYGIGTIGEPKKGAGFRRRQRVRIHRGIWLIRTVEVDAGDFGSAAKKIKPEDSLRIIQISNVNKPAGG